MDTDWKADWQDQQRQNGLIVTSVIMTTMATIFVVLRCISRFVIIKNPGLDDYFIIGALVFTIGYLIDIFVLRNNHLGFPMTMLTPDNMINFIKTTLAVQVMYYTIVFCIKTSIVYTYLRFAVTTTFRNLCIGTITVHALFFFICFVVTLAQCNPLHRMWDLTKTVEGTCINTTAFFYFTSAFNIITDIWILALPIKTLREIHRPTREKVALLIIFGVGTFAAVASIVRLHTIYTYTEATDPFREGVLVNVWSVIEVCIAISCASVSALKPVFSGRQRRIMRAGSDLRYTTTTTTGESKSGNRKRDYSRWHVRLGSKGEFVDGSGGQQRRWLSSGSGSGSDPGSSAEMAQVARALSVSSPVQRPRLVALPRDRGEGVAGLGEDAVMAFTAFGGPLRDDGGGEGRRSSSGSIWVLQR
ncbi:hypothetical protein B0T22DRAFT_482166 [Podospora appendiculata]|uniref:Rhodopsin domain-containing protein n=1 Tax=Podospora appendiculata TaxID=314037 RepID=A0AAE0X4P5_9PEZI|nr:hypothetical protein B0T22DRAFT_482166 [Podospora appendiculata]